MHLHLIILKQHLAFHVQVRMETIKKTTVTVGASLCAQHDLIANIVKNGILENTHKHTSKEKLGK